MCVYIARSSKEQFAVPVGPQEKGPLNLFPLHAEPHSHTPMRNPVDRAIKAMTFGAGAVGLLILTVFQLL